MELHKLLFSIAWINVSQLETVLSLPKKTIRIDRPIPLKYHQSIIEEIRRIQSLFNVEPIEVVIKTSNEPIKNIVSKIVSKNEMIERKIYVVQGNRCKLTGLSNTAMTTINEVEYAVIDGIIMKDESLPLLYKSGMIAFVNSKYFVTI